MIKILCTCPVGSGASLLMELTAKKALKKLGKTDYEIDHYPISDAKSRSSKCKFLFVEKIHEEVFKKFGERDIVVIGINNILSVEEFEEKISEGLTSKKDSSPKLEA
jgi:galactitol-specific phosphotransferase system IIB component